jgi:hypothetical protein
LIPNDLKQETKHTISEKRKTFGVMEKTLLMVFWKKKPDIFYYGRRTIA